MASRPTVYLLPQRVLTRLELLGPLIYLFKGRQGRDKTYRGSIAALTLPVCPELQFKVPNSTAYYHVVGY